jgi:hypothetical protein
MDEDRTRLLIKTVEELEKWMETDGRTDPKLIYWIPKFILMCDNKPFSQLGYMSDKMRALAASQEKINWQNFTEGYISWHFYNIQRFHLSMSNNFLNGSNCTKQFITKILQITHSQWIYRNISLHDKRQGYLHTKQSEDLVQEITELLELSPDEVPKNCRFLLEVNFTKLTSSHLETQQYWTLAMNAALAARQLKTKKGARSKQTHLKVNRKIPSQKKLGIEAIEQQIQLNGMHKPPTTNSTDDIHHGTQTTLTSLIIKRPHPSSTLTTLKSNKRLRKPD